MILPPPLPRKKFYKLKESLIRRYLKITHKNYDRAFSYYPYIKIDGNDVLFKNKKIFTAGDYPSLPKNAEEVYILGAGPSVNGQDISQIQNKNVIFLNGSIISAEKYGIKPFAYIIVDANFIINRADLVFKAPAGTNLLLSLSAIKAAAVFYPEILSKYKIFLVYIREEERLLSQLAPEQLPRGYFTVSQNKDTAFSSDPAQGFWDGGSVMSHAVQLCAYLNAKNVYLLGLDISNAASPRFYENDKNKQKSGLLKDYETKILPFMTLAAKIFKERGLNIYNCSPVSKLPYDVIPYKKFPEITL